MPSPRSFRSLKNYFVYEQVSFAQEITVAPRLSGVYFTGIQTADGTRPLMPEPGAFLFGRYLGHLRELYFSVLARSIRSKGPEGRYTRLMRISGGLPMETAGRQCLRKESTFRKKPNRALNERAQWGEKVSQLNLPCVCFVYS